MDDFAISAPEIDPVPAVAVSKVPTCDDFSGRWRCQNPATALVSDHRTGDLFTYCPVHTGHREIVATIVLRRTAAGEV